MLLRGSEPNLKARKSLSLYTVKQNKKGPDARITGRGEIEKRNLLGDGTVQRKRHPARAGTPWGGGGESSSSYCSERGNQKLSLATGQGEEPNADPAAISRGQVMAAESARQEISERKRTPDVYVLWPMKRRKKAASISGEARKKRGVPGRTRKMRRERQALEQKGVKEFWPRV